MYVSKEKSALDGLLRVGAGAIGSPQPGAR